VSHSTDERPPIDAGRFAFGENWRAFLDVLTPDRIFQAERSLCDMLDVVDLAGQRFLDIGSGSGLFSLAARRLGATVHSFDFDLQSVACTTELKRQHFPKDPAWTVELGSVLDSEYMRRLGQFDVVYSWGVLHHTGNMQKAIENASDRVALGGRLFIAIYNDQGLQSAMWIRVKRLYNRLPSYLKPAYLLAFGAMLELAAVGAALVRLQPQRLAKRWLHYENVRGMSRWHDIVDWVGGYPFEVAKPESILQLCRARGFEPKRVQTCGRRMGCNEFVFERREGTDLHSA